jgi:hypothetical protein
MSFVRISLAVLLVTGMTGMAFADTISATKDSADFAWKYEMTADPGTENLGGATPGTPPPPAAADWGNIGSPSGWTVSGGVASYTTDPNSSQYAYLEGFSDVTNPFASNITTATGYTMEMRIKSLTESHKTNRPAISFQATARITGDDKSSGLGISPTKTLWGSYGQASANTTLDSNDNASDFHVFRIAKEANGDHFHVWRDGVELASNLGGVADAGDHFYLGNYTTYWGGQTQIDYFRMIDGAYAPVPTPEPATSVILITGVLGLLAYAWRKRR